MEKTYPIFEHFYPIMFSYKGPNDHTDLPRSQNQNIDYMQAHFCRVLEGHSRAGSGEGDDSPS